MWLGNGALEVADAPPYVVFVDTFEFFAPKQKALFNISGAK